MGLMNQLIQRCYDFERQTMNKPTAIYLGRATYCDLKLELRDYLITATSAAIHSRRTEFNGLPVFVVDEEEHINVG